MGYTTDTIGVSLDVKLHDRRGVTKKFEQSVPTGSTLAVARFWPPTIV